MSKPPCMDAVEYATWTQANDLVGRGGKAHSPCADCLIGFALEMRDIGCCDGSPRGAVEPDDDADELRRQETQRRWADAEWREKQVQRIRDFYSDPVKVAQRSERIKAAWTPERRAAHIARNKDPELRRRRSETAKRRFAA